MKKITYILMVVLLVSAGTFTACSTAKEKTLADNQRYIYAYITDIVGNEITYMEVDESVINGSSEMESSFEDVSVDENGSDGEMPSMDANSMPEGFDPSSMGGMSSGGFPSGEGMPSGDFPGGGKGSDGEMPSMDASSMPEGFDISSISGKFDMTSTSTVTSTIPVGITVHTVQGSTTTFSRLASGDLVKILVETNSSGEDVIEEIWMIELTQSEE